MKQALQLEAALPDGRVCCCSLGLQQGKGQGVEEAEAGRGGSGVGGEA